MALRPSLFILFLLAFSHKNAQLMTVSVVETDRRAKSESNKKNSQNA